MTRTQKGKKLSRKKGKKQYLSAIFEPEPQQMGLRGDLYFWRSLKEFFSTKELPYSEAQLIGDIYRLFQEVSGEPLADQCSPSVKQYMHGGMSDGCLSGKYWIESGIPLIIERYRALAQKGAVGKNATNCVK